MRLDESVRNLEQARDFINQFEKDCKAEEYTDTDAAWNVLHEARRAITDVLESWENSS